MQWEIAFVEMTFSKMHQYGNTFYLEFLGGIS